MSSEIARTLNLNNGETSRKAYLNCGSAIYSSAGVIDIATTGSNENGWATYNSAAMDVLYPNSTAHPTKAVISHGYYKLGSDYGRVRLSFNGSDLFTDSSSRGNTTYTSSAITSSTKSSKITWWLSHGWFTGVSCTEMKITLYFTRYDFSAEAEKDSGITSASVSSSTGYGGADITFSCVIPTGYVFDGWYKAGAQTPYSTAQSFTYTIPTDNAANYDLALTAKAHQDTHSVTGTYNGSTKAILTGITGNVSVSYNGKTKTMPTDATEFTLGETNKAMHTDVVVGSAAPLQCAELLMHTPLVIKYV